MISHYLTIAWRNLQRHQLFSFLNLAGLTIGLSFALLIFLWVYDEWKMDRFHERSADLYQVLQQYPTPEGIEVVDWTPALLAPTLVEELPEIEFATATKTGPFAKGIVVNGTKSFRVDGKLVSSDFLKVFSYPLLQGNPEKILQDKYEVVISEELAVKLFDSVEGSLGQTVQWEKTGFYDYKDNFTVGGVFANVPAHSSDQFDLLFNASYYLDQDKSGSYNWGNNPMATTVMLLSGADPKALGEQITQLVKTRNNQVENTFFLASYSKQYLYGNYENGVQAGGRIAYVLLFSLIAIIILLIASINFMNLSTARAMHRAKEIGVKKTMGAHRQILVGQFVSESLFLAGIALLLSTLLVQLLLPEFNEITGKALKLEFDPRIVVAFLLITVFT
ncbi:MAG: ABC transporter permease, partial [Bacteroidota bacterium]